MRGPRKISAIPIVFKKGDASDQRELRPPTGIGGAGLNISMYLKKHADKIDRALLRCLPKASHPLHQAMRYAVLGNGKRLRPVLALAACEAVGGDKSRVLPAACAIELIHSYSLIHDDLPCMDDDDFRRGKPSCHKKFGESTALLAGDALLTLAFQILTKPFVVGAQRAVPLQHAVPQHRAAFRQLIATGWIAEAAGFQGMVGGQAVDLEYQRKRPSLKTLQYIHNSKTGALLAVAFRVGAYLGKGTPKEIRTLYHFGQKFGFLFQIVDDILDAEGYAIRIGKVKARQRAERLAREAKILLKPFGKKATFLYGLTDFILDRKN